MTAVGDVMWLTTISRVRSVAAAKIAATVSSAVRNGSGRTTVLAAAPALSQARCQIRWTAPYSWSVSSTSSPAASGNESATMFMPTVAFSTKIRFALRSSHEGRQPVAGREPGRLELAHEEVHRLLLERLDPLPPRLANCLGRRTERAVVQVRRVGADVPVAGERRPGGVVVGRQIHPVIQYQICTPATSP